MSRQHACGVLHRIFKTIWAPTTCSTNWLKCTNEDTPTWQYLPKTYQKKKKKKERRLCLTKYESSLHVISLLTLRTYHHVDNRELSCVICLILPDQHRTHPLTFLVKFLPRILITMVNFTGSPQMTMQNRWWTRRLWSINITRTEKTTWILKVRFMNQNIKGCLIGRTYNNCFLLHTPMITTTTKQKGGNNK